MNTLVARFGSPGLTYWVGLPCFGTGPSTVSKYNTNEQNCCFKMLCDFFQELLLARCLKRQMFAKMFTPVWSHAAAFWPCRIWCPRKICVKTRKREREGDTKAYYLYMTKTQQNVLNMVTETWQALKCKNEPFVLLANRWPVAKSAVKSEWLEGGVNVLSTWTNPPSKSGWKAYLTGL